jgi:hypothetical protein
VRRWQGRRQLAIAMTPLDGTSRLDAARQAGMSRQTMPEQNCCNSADMSPVGAHRTVAKTTSSFDACSARVCTTRVSSTANAGGPPAGADALAIQVGVVQLAHPDPSFGTGLPRCD